MPVYEYQCRTCGIHFERRQSFKEICMPGCPNGHAQVQRVFRVPGIVFKGSGWYVTDSGSKGRTPSANS